MAATSASGIAESWMPPNGANFVGRANYFRPETSFHLGVQELEITRGGKIERVPYREITALWNYPVMLQDGYEKIHARRCLISTARRSFMSQSAHFKGWMGLELRREAHNAFLSDLADRVAEANPEHVFWEGMGPKSRFGWISLVVLCCVFGIVGIFTAPAGLGLTSACFVTGSIAFRMLKKEGGKHRVHRPTPA